MKEIIIAVGLLFFIEGLFLAIFQSRIKNMLEVIKNTPENSVTPDKMFIAGFEIPFPAPELVSSDHPDYNKDLPLFSKTANSDVLYAAGWYAINFEKGWKHGNCPKLSTLITYGYEGPFKTKIELKQRLKVLNKIKRQASKVHAK